MAVLGGGWLASIEDADSGFSIPYCHATTSTQTGLGLVLAFFDGEGPDRQHVRGMRSGPRGWGPAEQVVEQTDYMDPCWNPILHHVVVDLEGLRRW